MFALIHVMMDFQVLSRLSSCLGYQFCFLISALHSLPCIQSPFHIFLHVSSSPLDRIILF